MAAAPSTATQANAGDDRIGPAGPQREAEAQAAAAGEARADDDAAAGDRRDDPGGGGAERAFHAAAEGLEARIHGRDGLAAS